MALIIKDRVRETTTSVGTGDILLGGAVTGYQAFSAVLINGDTTYYTIANSYQWEVGLGTYNSSSNTLTRTQVLASSNFGSLVNFDTGTKDIFIDYPASTAVYKTTNGRVSIGSIYNNYNPQLRALYLDGASGTQLGFGVNNNEYSFILANSLYTTLATSGATSIKLGTNNLNRLIIDSAGRASLGYDPPPSQYAFSVVSNTALGSSNGVYIANSSYDTGLSLAGGNVAGSLLTSANGIELSSTSAAKSLLFKTVSTERMRIDASGNVGIGNTPSGTYKLEVTGGVGANTFTPTSVSVPTRGMYAPGSTGLGFSTSSTLRLTISSTGNISATAGTTAMTDGFFYIPAAAGAPSGTPTAVSGTVPMYYDTTNNQFYVYNGAWNKVALT